MTVIMKGKYKTAKELGMKYPVYTLFSEERTKPEDIFETEIIYGIIRQYDESVINISLFESLDSAYKCYRLFLGFN